MPLPVSVRMPHARACFIMPLCQNIRADFLIPVPHVRAYILITLPVSVLMPVPHLRAYFLMSLPVSRSRFESRVALIGGLALT